MNEKILQYFKEWIILLSDSSLESVSPYEFMRIYSTDENQTILFFSDLVKEGVAEAKVVIRCPRCGIEEIVNSWELEEEFECDCHKIFIPNEAKKDVVYNILNKKYFDNERRLTPLDTLKGTIKHKSPRLVVLDGNIDMNRKDDNSMLNVIRQKVFLSHKGADKEIVRDYFYLLKEIGFEPWLDEDAMTAGSKLYRSLLEGFKQSCAAIFFITPNFVDEACLSMEIDYAIEETMGYNKFTIITLLLADENGNWGKVPDLLKRFVWKEPENHLVAFKEIIKALPIKVKSIG